MVRVKVFFKYSKIVKLSPHLLYPQYGQTTRVYSQDLGEIREYEISEFFTLLQSKYCNAREYMKEVMGGLILNDQDLFENPPLQNTDLFRPRFSDTVESDPILSMINEIDLYTQFMVPVAFLDEDGDEISIANDRDLAKAFVKANEKNFTLKIYIRDVGRGG